MQFLKLWKTNKTVKMCKSAPKGAHAHICQRQMCLPVPKGAHAYICLRQMCLHAPEGDHITFAFGKCVYLHQKGLTCDKIFFIYFFILDTFKIIFFY